MASGVCCSHSDAYIMLTISKKEEQQQQAKNGYWQNELHSLGIEQKEKKELNNKEENENLADNIKQSMFQDYKIAYSEKGDTHKEEAKSTVTVGLLLS
jgi:hypothetical protein